MDNTTRYAVTFWDEINRRPIAAINNTAAEALDFASWKESRNPGTVRQITRIEDANWPFTTNPIFTVLMTEGQVWDMRGFGIPAL